MDTSNVFSGIYNNMPDILAHPERYTDKVTHFSAGGLGACAYQEDITAAELAGCSQHEEYRSKCPECGETVYITRWAGHTNAGGYWQMRSYCPRCGKEDNDSFCRHTSPQGEDIHWKRMRDIVKEVQETIKNNQ